MFDFDVLGLAGPAGGRWMGRAGGASLRREIGWGGDVLSQLVPVSRARLKASSILWKDLKCVVVVVVVRCPSSVVRRPSSDVRPFLLSSHVSVLV